MSTNKSKRTKRKGYFLSSNPNKKRKYHTNLVHGMRGFVCTCNGNEKGCIREAFNILDSYDMKLNPKPDTDYKDEACPESDDIEKQLKDEINDAKKPEKRFRVADTGANNCVFISAKVPNVVEIAEKIMKDAKRNALPISRHLIRLLPVEVTCKAYNEDIKKAAESIFDLNFKGEPTSYCIHVNKRSNNNLLRMEVINDLARLVQDRNINHTVDLKNPAKTVIVEIIRNVCCLSVVNNFFGFRKYNLIELCHDVKSTDNTDEVNRVITDESPLGEQDHITSGPEGSQDIGNVILVREESEE